MTRSNIIGQLQRGWWLVGIFGALVGALGFQTFSPAERIARLERMHEEQLRTDTRQDSLFQAHVNDKQIALDAIYGRLRALVAGQCVKERNDVARLAYGCGT